MTGHSEEFIRKVNHLLDGNCVALVEGYADRAAVVNGQTSWYTVRCYEDGMTCDCPAGIGPAWCTHRAAAAIVWAEAEQTPFGPVPR